MLYYQELGRKIFEMQDNLASSNNIVIVSGYIGYQTIKMLGDACPDTHITIVYGMYGSECISQPLHQALNDIQTEYKNIEILYSTIPVHSKIYTWKCDENIEKALIGSANFSISGLMNDYKEVLADVENNTFQDLKGYCDYICSKSISCKDSSVKIKKISKAKRNIKDIQPLLSKNICRATLLNSQNLVSKKSGLNWGLSKGHVSEGDAYIRITMDNIKNYPNMFPPKKYLGIDNPLSTGRKNGSVEI